MPPVSSAIQNGNVPQFSLSQKSSWLFIIPACCLVALLVLPVLALLERTTTSGSWTAVTQPTALTALRLSLYTSTVSLFLIILTGTPLAYWLARGSFRGKSWLKLVVDLPIVLPPSVAGLALLVAFGRRGVLGQWLTGWGISLPFTTTAVILAQLFVAAPLYVQAVRIGFAAIDPQLEEAAYTEGANQWQVFRYVVFPMSWTAVVSGGILAWMRALGEFGATILFAGNLAGRTQTIPLAIYLGFEQNTGTALALSALLLLISFLFMALLRQLEGKQLQSEP